MPLVSIIGCESSAKELVELLAKDDSIDRLAIVNGRSKSILKDLDELNVEHEVLSSDSLPAGLSSDNGFNVILTLQSNSLRSDLSKLKKETYEKIKFYGQISDSILLFYGSCDGTFNGIYDDFKKPRFSLKTLFMEKSNSENVDVNGCFSVLGDDIDSNMQKLYDRCYNELKKDLLS
jgi:hypothetical protein